MGVWDSFDEIDFTQLPDQFVLKCNHDSGSVKVIKDKSKINKKELKKFFEGRLSINCYCLGREYPYKNVQPKIFAEKLIDEFEADSIVDYKFFCFCGVPRLLLVGTGSGINRKCDFYNMDFKHLDIYNIHPNSDKGIEKPKTFEEMKRIATILSEKIPFVRVDLYEIDDQVYFGEYTFFHGGGFYLFSPEKWERELGGYIKIEEL